MAAVCGSSQLKAAGVSQVWESSRLHLAPFSDFSDHHICMKATAHCCFAVLFSPQQLFFSGFMDSAVVI